MVGVGQFGWCHNRSKSRIRVKIISRIHSPQQSFIHFNFAFNIIWIFITLWWPRTSVLCFTSYPCFFFPPFWHLPYFLGLWLPHTLLCESYFWHTHHACCLWVIRQTVEPYTSPAQIVSFSMWVLTHGQSLARLSHVFIYLFHLASNWGFHITV